MASTLLTDSDKVYVYDSVYNTVNKETRDIIKNLFGSSKSVRSIPISKQMGGQDCGIFAIAIATTLAFGKDPAPMKFKQSGLRSHLVDCIDAMKMSPFPLFEP